MPLKRVSRYLISLAAHAFVLIGPIRVLDTFYHNSIVTAAQEKLGAAQMDGG